MKDLKDQPVVTATINRITAASSGGWRVTFDIPDTETDQVTKLANLRQKVLTLCILTGEIQKD